MITKIKDYILLEKENKEIFWSYIAKLVSLVGLGIFLVLIPNLLGPELYGEYNIIIAYISFIGMILGFGLTEAPKPFLSMSIDKDSKKFYLYLKSANTLKILNILSVVLLLIILRPFIENLLKMSLSNIEYFLFILAFIFINLWGYLVNIFRGIYRIKYIVVVNLLESVGKTIFVLLAFIYFKNTFGILIALVFTFAIITFYGFWVLKTRFLKNIPLHGKREHCVCAREIFKYSLSIILVSFTYVILSRIDVMMLNYFSTKQEVGFYSLAHEVAKGLIILVTPLIMGIAPRFAQITKMERRALFYNYLKKITIVLILTLMPAYFILPHIISFVYGETYIRSIAILQVLIIYSLFLAFSLYFGEVITFIKKAKILSLMMSVSIILNIILNYILIPQYAGVGAAIATTISFSFYPVFSFIYLKKEFG